jgi:type I restriction enzyme S subunit
MKRIGDILTRNKTAVEVEDVTSYKQVTIRTNYKGVVLRGTQNGSTILTKNQFAVSAGQFILSRIDARNGAFGIVPEELEGAIVTNDFLAFDINEDEVEREFFNVFLQSPVFLEACIKASRGNTNRKRVDEDFFLNYQVNLPQLSEQHDLIRQINKGRTRIALAQAEITHQQTLLAKLKQAILQEAIQGKLTAAWREANPDVEPASQLLQRIQAEKARLIAEKKLRPEKPLPKITSAEIPFEIPKGWEWCPLAAVMILRDGERIPISKSERERRGKVYPYYGASGVIDEIDGFTHDGAYLLLGEDGSNLRLRSTPIAFGASGKIWVNNHAHVLEFIEPILQEFIAHRINGMDIAPFVTGGFQPKLSQENLNRIPIPLPPLAEQAAIVERVESLMTTCRALETEIEQSRTHAANLLQAVLKEAFAPASMD